MAYYKCGSVYTTQNSNVGINTASGDIASFQTNLAMALQKLKIAFSASQDLHGYSKPWIGGAGSNKWDEEWEVGYYNVNTGVPTPGTNQIRCKNRISVEPNTNYYIKVPSSIWILEFDANDDYLNVYTSKRDAVLTTSANTHYIRFYTLNTYGDTYNNDIAINYPSTVTTYSPYENICPITGFSQANVFRMGKNLLKVSSDNVKRTNGNPTITYLDNGVTMAVPSVGAFYAIWSLFRVKSDMVGKTLTISGSGYNSWRIVSSNTDDFSGTVNNKSTNMGTYTIVSDDIGSYFGVRMYNDSGTTQTTTDIQVEFHETATDFIAYHGNTYLLQFGDTYYGCEIDVVHGKLKVIWGYAEFDGSNDESWYNYGLNDFHGFRTVISDMKSGNNMFGYCNYLKVQNQVNEIGIRFGASNNNSLYLFHIYDTIPELNNSSDIADWRTYLSTHVLKVVYPLNEPIEVDIDSAIITALTGEVNQVYCDIPTSTVDLEYKVVNL